MNLENLIKEQAVHLKSTRRNIDIAPDIPEEILKKWEKKYSNILEDEIRDYVLVMSYTSTGNFALTGDAIYYDNFLQGEMQILKYVDIADVLSKPGGLFSPDQVLVKMKTGDELYLDACIDGIHVEKFAEIFAEIIKCAKQQILTVSRQTIPLYEISDRLKLLYLKVLCNYAYIDNDIIDSQAYNAISRFSVRMEIVSETRNALRNYMNEIEQRQKTGYLIAIIKQIIGNESGQWDAFRYSLLQDVIYIHDLHDSRKTWREDGFIGSLMQACDLKPAQIDTMIQAIGLNEEMLKKDADLKIIKKEWKKFIKDIRYSDGYVPTMYLFCSGSIYGIDNYNSFLKKDDTSEKAVNKQRELILHEIIENTQKTINILIDDMNYIAEKIEKLVGEKEKLEENYRKLVIRLTQGMKAMSQLKSSKEDKEQEFDKVRRTAEQRGSDDGNKEDSQS